MAEFLSVILVILCLLGTSISHQETNERISKLIKKPCANGKPCPTSNDAKGISNKASKSCNSDTDCTTNEYCHSLHRLCLKPRELATVAPAVTSRKKCSQDSDCKMKEYCHNFWKICLPSQTAAQNPPPTKRPSWYCRTTEDCEINEQCHKRFHACYTRPGMSTVRRDAGNSRKCEKTSECGANFYCHDHFRICLEIKPTGTMVKSTTKSTKSCDANTPCPKGKLCHNLWNICYTPAQVLPLPKKNKTQQCQIDSDCAPGEYCHALPSGNVVARQKRTIEKVCLSQKFRQQPKSNQSTKCKTNADCGPNQCCLGNLSVCMPYKLPGEMCLVAKTDLVCGCTSGSYCKTRGKLASPRRIVNKMKLPQTAANHFLKSSNKKKRKVGKCTPSSF